MYNAQWERRDSNPCLWAAKCQIWQTEWSLRNCQWENFFCAWVPFLLQLLIISFMMGGKGSKSCWRCSLAGCKLMHCAHASSHADGRPVPRLCWETQFSFSSSWPFPQSHDVIKKKKKSNKSRASDKMFRNSLSCTLLWGTTVAFPCSPFKIWHLNYIPF